MAFAPPPRRAEQQEEDDLPFWEEAGYEEKPEKELQHHSEMLQRRDSRPARTQPAQLPQPSPQPSPQPFQPFQASQASQASQISRRYSSPALPSSALKIKAAGRDRAATSLSLSPFSPATPLSPPTTATPSDPSDSSTWKAEKAEKAEKERQWLQVPSFRPAASAAFAAEGAAERMLVETLLVALRHAHGNSLKAWRCDFDKHCVGWVSQAEFARACRFYGCPADQIWSSCRTGGGAGMKFWELDYDEASNLENFEQVLWIRTGFDLSRAWAMLDRHNRQALTLQEFVRGCRELGFEGDAHHIFKGLDHQGLGRLSRTDFEYLQKVASSSAQGLNIELRMLRSWACEVCADTVELLQRLSMIDDHAGGWVQTLEPIGVAEFAHRLEILGFPGDPTDIATEVMRCRGQGQMQNISVEHLCCALFGPKQLRRSGTAKEAEKPRSGGHKNPIRKAEWDSTIFSSYRTNTTRPSSLRMYFSTPAKEPIRRAASNPALLRATAKASKKAERAASPSREESGPRRVRPGELNHRP